MLRSTTEHAFEPEEGHLPLQPSAVADEAAVRPDDAMAGQHDRDGVAIHDRADRARCLRIAGPRGEAA